MTDKIKKHFSEILIFALGIGWGDLWITELLSCPEWWFFAVNALLVGCGIWIIRKLPDDDRSTIAAFLSAAVLLLDASDLRSVLLPLIFGCWYGSNEALANLWRESRTFCGGLLLGAAVAGIFTIPQLPAVLATVIFIDAGFRSSKLRFAELTIFAVF